MPDAKELHVNNHREEPSSSFSILLRRMLQEESLSEGGFENENDIMNEIVTYMLFGLILFLLFYVCWSCCNKKARNRRRLYRVRVEQQRRRQLELRRWVMARQHANSVMGQQQQQRQQQGLTPEERQRMIDRRTKEAEGFRKALLASFVENKVEMVIRSNDLKVEESTQSSNATTMDNDVDVESSIPQDENNNNRREYMVQLPNNHNSVPDTCPICLETYTEGETIVWSSNEKCHHGFHRSCMVEYLVQLHIGGDSNTDEQKHKTSPCPCCRQPFCRIPTL